MKEKKIIITETTVIISLEDGSSYSKINPTREEINKIIKAENIDELLEILDPQYLETKKKINEINDFINRVKESNILTIEDNIIYWKEISNYSIPKELVDSILEAENNNDNIKIDTYRNFWTLMSLNPDEKCRKNLYWFLKRNGLIISKCGFFVAYRNVIKTDKVDEDNNPIYTDSRTRTFRIKIGEMVTMPREKCDDNQEETCSRGLHLGARTWLKQNYCGDTGIVCLCNPADVIAVPKKDYYGKLRTCAYLPIELAKFDRQGDVVPFNASDGFDCSYVSKVIYEGLIGTSEDSSYIIKVPNLPFINKNKISDKLFDIALKCITERTI